MTGHKTAIPGYRLDKTGKIVRDEKKLDLCARLKRKNSKRVRVAKHVVGQRSFA